MKTVPILWSLLVSPDLYGPYPGDTSSWRLVTFRAMIVVLSTFGPGRIQEGLRDGDHKVSQHP